MELRQCTILPTIDEIAMVQPFETALEDGLGNSLTWSQMMFNSMVIGKALAALCLPAHSRIGVLQEPSTDWIVSILGIWRSGNAYVPLEISQGTKRLGNITRSARLAVLLTHDLTTTIAPQLGVAKSVAIINVSSLRSPKDLDRLELPSVAMDDEAMVMFTSGSTGVPKVSINFSCKHNSVCVSFILMPNCLREFRFRIAWSLMPYMACYTDGQCLPKR